MTAASRAASTRSTNGSHATTAGRRATATTSCSFRAERVRSRRDHGPALARPAHHVEQHLPSAIRRPSGAIAVVQEPPVAAGRLQDGPVARALPALVGLQDRVLCPPPRAVDAARARDAERVLADARRTTVAAGVEQIEPAVTPDDARTLHQSALPAVTVPDHDLVRRSGQLQAVARQRLHPDRAGHVAAVLLPDEEGAPVDVAHHARVDRGARLADERPVVGVRADRIRRVADGDAGPAVLLPCRVVNEVAIAVALEPRPPLLPSAAPRRRGGGDVAGD